MNHADTLRKLKVGESIIGEPLPPGVDDSRTYLDVADVQDEDGVRVLALQMFAWEVPVQKFTVTVNTDDQITVERFDGK